jgi:hypothetical protein
LGFPFGAFTTICGRTAALCAKEFTIAPKLMAVTPSKIAAPYAHALCSHT